MVISIFIPIYECQKCNSHYYVPIFISIVIITRFADEHKFWNTFETVDTFTVEYIWTYYCIKELVFMPCEGENSDFFRSVDVSLKYENIKMCVINVKQRTINLERKPHLGEIQILASTHAWFHSQQIRNFKNYIVNHCRAWNLPYKDSGRICSLNFTCYDYYIYSRNNIPK